MKINIGKWFKRQGITTDNVLKELGRATGYVGSPQEWGAKLAFDLATGQVSVASLKASVSKAAQMRAVAELMRLQGQIGDAIADLEAK